MLPSEITLHIGLQKTGTTLIQRSLKKLRGRLGAQGVAYVDRVEMSRLPAIRGWRAFRDSSLPEPELAPTMRAFRLHEADQVNAFTEQLRELAIQRCAEVASTTGSQPRHLVVSNEALVGAQAPDFGPLYRPRAEAALSHLLLALEPQRSNLILYVRRQDTLLESQYMQRIHDGEVHDFADFAGRATAQVFIQYADLVERLLEVESVVDVRVRPFETIGAGPEAFVGDMLRPLDLDLDLSGISVRQANARYTAPALEAALAINPMIEDRGQLRATRKYLRRAFPTGKYPPPILFDEAGRQRVLNMYDSSNRAFLAKYVPEASPDAYSSPAATESLVHLI